MNCLLRNFGNPGWPDGRFLVTIVIISVTNFEAIENTLARLSLWKSILRIGRRYATLFYMHLVELLSTCGRA